MIDDEIVNVILGEKRMIGDYLNSIKRKVCSFR